MNPDTKPEQTNGKPQWKPSLHYYDIEERRVLTFPDEESINAALDLIWIGHLRGIPFDLAGGDSIVIPKEAVHYFSEAGLPFHEDRLLTTQELTAEELNELRKQRRY